MDKNVLQESLELVNQRLDAKKLPEDVQMVLNALGTHVDDNRSISDLKDILKVFQNFKNVLYCAENVHPNCTNINTVDKMTKIIDDFESAVQNVSDYETKTQINDFKVFNFVLKKIKSVVSEPWFNSFCNKLNIVEINSDYSDMYNIPMAIDNFMAINQDRYFIMLDPENDKCVEIAEVRLNMLETLQKVLKEVIQNKDIDWNVDRSSINYKN